MTAHLDHPHDIGLIGGLSWESTALYYRLANREVSRRRGRLHSASMTIKSLDFEPIGAMQRAGDWQAMATRMSDAACALAAAGAGCVLIGSNTMHRLAPAVEAALASRAPAGSACLPLIHIADVAAEAILATPARRVGLLGTRMTMEQSFYVDFLARHGIECLTPPADERQEIHRIIFDELFLGRVEATSRAWLHRVIDGLTARGAEGVLLGCTELPMLVAAGDCAVPVFDTTALHAMAAVDYSLDGRLPFAPR